MEQTSQSGSALANIRKIMIIATFGGLLFGYDTGVINGALPFMSRPEQLNLTPSHEGMVVSILLLGAALGALCGGRIADHYGRRSNIIALAVIFCFAAIGCSLAPSFHVMLVTRFFLGIAVGGASVTVPTYLAEMSPAEIRGRMVTQNEFMIVTGQFLAFVCNAILAVTLGNDPHVWRYMLAICALPAFVLFFGMLRMPESPRWLVMAGRISEGLSVIRKIRNTEEKAIAEFNEIQDNIKAQSAIVNITFSDITIPWVRRIILTGIGLACFVHLTGVNSIMYYGTTILNQSGFSTQASIIANTLNGLTSVVAVAVGMHLMMRVRRRRMMLVGFTGTTTALALITVASMTLNGSPIFPYVILALTVFFLAFMQSCIGPIFWCILPEMIPMRLRGLGMGICVLFVWMVNFVIALVFPVLLDKVGLEGTFMIFMVIGVFAVIFTKIFVPETKGKSLEQIEREFRNYNREVSHKEGTLNMANNHN